MDNLRKSFLVKGNSIVGAVGDKNFSTLHIGCITPYLGTKDNIPNGYLLADGASYKTTDYPELFNIIGYTYGGSDDTFNVPNLCDGRFLEGSDTSGEYVEAGLPNITGGWMPVVPPNYQLYVSGAVASEIKSSGLVSAAATAQGIGAGFKIDASKSSAVYGNSDTVQPKSLRVLYIIKAFHTNESVDSGVSDDVINYINNNIKKVVQYENAIQLVNTDYIRTDDIGFRPILSRTGNIVTLSMRLWCKEVDTPTDIPFKVLDIPDGYKPIDNIYSTAPTNNINKTLVISYTLIDSKTNSVLIRTYNENLNGQQLYFPIMTWITNDELPN